MEPKAGTSRETIPSKMTTVAMIWPYCYNTQQHSGKEGKITMTKTVALPPKELPYRDTPTQAWGALSARCKPPNQ